MLTRLFFALLALGLAAPSALADGELPVEPRPIVQPWTDADSKRADKIVDHIAAVTETLVPLGDDEAAARAALKKYFAFVKTTPKALVAEGEWLNGRFRESPQGMAEYFQRVTPRFERLAKEIQKLSPASMRVLQEVFEEAAR